MTDPKEFNSLDELFRKTFEDLPDTPAESGWDTPSPRVWDQVQVRLKPPHSGWSTQTILLVCGMAIALMLGLYWALLRPEPPKPPAATEVAPQPGALPPPVEIPANPAPNSPQSTASVEQENTPAARVRKERRQESRQNARAGTITPAAITPPSNSREHAAEEPARPRPAGSALLPGSQPVSPNTTVLRQRQAWLRAPWAKPLAPLPTVLEMQVIHPIPAAVKELTAPKTGH